MFECNDPVSLFIVNYRGSKYFTSQETFLFVSVYFGCLSQPSSVDLNFTVEGEIESAEEG